MKVYERVRKVSKVIIASAVIALMTNIVAITLSGNTMYALVGYSVIAFMSVKLGLFMLKGLVRGGVW
ncbi:MAG: hypothetical protein QXM12_00685 [Nitrososphaerota archaeon]